jgi:hypothetical protein
MSAVVAREISDARSHWIVGGLSVIHAVFAILSLFLLLRLGVPEVLRRIWVALVTIWFFWPIVLLLHRGRSLLRVAVPLALGGFVLLVCAPWFTSLAPRVFAGTARMPTLDRPNIVESENIGGGFRRVRTEEFMTGGFESIYHGEYLHYGARRLAYFVSSSVSPSRAFAAYADLDFDSERRDNEYGFHVFIFRTADQQIVRVTSEALYYQGEFRWQWDEAAGHVLLHFKDGRSPEKFPLAMNRPNQAMQRIPKAFGLVLLRLAKPR